MTAIFPPKIPANIIQYIDLDAIQDAIQCGDIEGVDFFSFLGQKMPEDAMEVAITYRHFDLAKHLHDAYHQKYNQKLLRWVIESGYKEFAVTIHADGIEWPENAIDLAASAGDEEMVLMFHGLGFKPTIAAMNLVTCGYIEMLELLYSIGAECTDESLKNAISSGNFGIVQFLCETVGVKCTISDIGLARKNRQMAIANYLCKKINKN